MKALEKGGPVHALDFCNVQAIPITIKLEDKKMPLFKRVSDKNQNPNNAANKEEKHYINHFKQNLKKAQEPVPVAFTIF